MSTTEDGWEGVFGSDDYDCEGAKECELCGVKAASYDTRDFEFDYKWEKVVAPVSGMYCANCKECVQNAEDWEKTEQAIEFGSPKEDTSFAAKVERAKATVIEAPIETLYISTISKRVAPAWMWIAEHKSHRRNGIATSANWGRHLKIYDQDGKEESDDEDEWEPL